MRYKDEILQIIKERSLAGLPTSPDTIIRELRIDDWEVEKTLRELHRERMIRLYEVGWIAS